MQNQVQTNWILDLEKKKKHTEKLPPNLLTVSQLWKYPASDHVHPVSFELVMFKAERPIWEHCLCS